ncbi:MAG TPA: hypothetical protein VD841_09175 [Arthrobacter sp.]|nr:hypothetical protein [Arthrobacter sp.]
MDNPSLAGAVERVDLVRPSGEQLSLSRADGAEVLGCLVGLGALGIVTGLELADKLFTPSGHDWEALYPRFADFRAMAAANDPEGKFRNGLLDSILGAPAASLC